MKHIKKLSLIFIFIFIILFNGCTMDDPKYINFKEKPSLNYYCTEIHNRLLKGENYSLSIYDTNVTKLIRIDDSEKVIVDNFFSYLSNDSYQKYENITDIEPYQFRIIFDDIQYVIKIFNNEKVSIFPWDGTYNEDIISMTNIPARYNLYDFCEYIKNRVYSNQ